MIHEAGGKSSRFWAPGTEQGTFPSKVTSATGYGKAASPCLLASRHNCVGGGDDCGGFGIGAATERRNEPEPVAEMG
jgi:hypothetical protein